MPKTLLFGLFVALTVLPAQVPEPAPAPTGTPTVASDPRATPRSAVFGFLAACSQDDYRRAASFLSLRRGQDGPRLARQLQEILDRALKADPGRLSARPEGDLTDGLDPQVELLGTIRLGARIADLTLERVTAEGQQIWLISAGTVQVIPALHDALEPHGFEARLPSWLRRKGPVETSWWVWLLLAVLVAVAVLISGLVARLIVRTVQPLLHRTRSDFDDTFVNSVVNPVRLLLGVVGFQAGLYALPASVLLRTYLSRAMTGIAYLAIAWVAMRLIDMIAVRAVARMTGSQRASATSILPLARRSAKAAALAFAVIATLNSWGYNTTALLAGLGVGGLAIALAAQKTLENLFGGVAITSDKAVLVGDFCRYGNKVGTVEDIGLRSTRIRTLDRTVVTIPNGQFSSLEIENFGPRDKIFFHPTLQLRKDATPEQVRAVIAGLREVLINTPKVDPAPARVRLIAIGQWSLDLEVFAYVLTTDFDEFLVIQEALLLRFLEVVAAAGTALAVPAQMNLLRRESPGLPRQQLLGE